MRVLHLPTSVGGNAWGLAQAEKGIGLHSDVLVATESVMNYPADIRLYLDKVPSVKKQFLKALWAFLRLRRKYDVFHFNYGTSLVHFPHKNWAKMFDLPWYPKKAKLFVTYNGCDARQKYKTMERRTVAACHDAECYGGRCNSGEEDRLRREGIEKMALYTEHMFALNPDLLHFLPKEKSSFLPYTVSSFDLPLCLPTFEGKLKVVHAPTNRAIKGSGIILPALERLVAKYPKEIEVILVEGLPYEKALQIYRQADLIIDQMLLGWYGAFAVEAMLMGKPVVVYIESDDLHFVPKAMSKDLLETVIHASPKNIYDVLERSIQDRLFLKERAESGLEYAHKWHSPEYVAQLTQQYYTR